MKLGIKLYTVADTNKLLLCTNTKHIVIIAIKEKSQVYLLSCTCTRLLILYTYCTVMPYFPVTLQTNK
jgi:hypothetical protein